MADFGAPIAVKLDSLLAALQSWQTTGLTLALARFMGIELDFQLIDPPEPVTFAGSGIAGNQAAADIPIQTLDRDGIYRITLSVVQGTAPAGAHPWDLRFWYEGATAPFMIFRRQLGQAIGEVTWDYTFFLKKNWKISLFNAIAYGVAETSGYGYNVLRHTP